MPFPAKTSSDAAVNLPSRSADQEPEPPGPGRRGPSAGCGPAGDPGPGRMGAHAQHRDLVPEDQDLRVLRGITAHQQHQPAEHPDHEHADETDEHKRRA
jgi:hypothetical protein